MQEGLLLLGSMLISVSFVCALIVAVLERFLCIL